MLYRSAHTTPTSTLERHFTASSLILHEERVVLIHHRKLNSWVLPGGHLEPNETPSDGAVREALEETGLHIRLIDREELRLDHPLVKSLPRPYLCLLMDSRVTHQPAHQHIDFVYLAQPVGGILKENLIETKGVKWFSREEIPTLEPCFPDVRELVLHVFDSVEIAL